MISPQSAIPLAPHTSLRIGGAATWFGVPGSHEELADAVRFARDRDHPVLVIGNGTNLVVSDQGWPGVAIVTSGMRRGIVWEGAQAQCDGGVMFPVLVRESIERGCGGIERLGGIPGTVGGAAVMNAGAWGQDLGAVIRSVTIVELTTGNEREMSPQELAFGYRTSVLHHGKTVVTAVRCAFAPGERPRLEHDAVEAMRKRRAAQPLDTRNCGSVFRNPEGGGSAGALIDRCGLKGRRIGDIAVSEKHANFIINTGNGCAQDFRRMVIHVQKTVWENTGVKLTPEVVFAGEFEDALLFE